MFRTLKRRAFIAPMAMVVAVVLSIIGVGLLSIGFNRRMTSIRANRRIAARSAADYGLTKALYEMNQKLRAETWNDTSLPTESDASVPGTNALYSYSVSGDMWTGYTAQATGTCGFATRAIDCDLKLKGIFEHAILTRTTLDLINDSLIDWFNYDDDDERLKVGTTSVLPDAIILKSGVTINGDLLVGQGAIPADVVDNQGATISGLVYPVASDNDLTMPEVPASLAAAPSLGTISSTIPITESGKYENIRLNNGEILTIAADIEIYVEGDITLDNSARIDVDPNNPDAELTIYLGGSLDGLNGSGFNNLNDPDSGYPAGDPHKLTVYGLASCESIIIKNSAVFCGTIYAPNATVDMHNSAEIYGSVVADSYIQRNSATFWYDATLREVDLEDDFVRFVPTHCREQ